MTARPRENINNNKGGVLTKQEIIDLAIIQCENKLADTKCYKPTTYDLRLGGEYFDPGKMTDGDTGVRDCTSTDIVVAPFSSVIVSTLEKIVLPSFVVARFNLRVEFALRGLFAQMGTQVEPGYEGHLYAMIQNISNNEIRLHHGNYSTRLFSIEFAYTSEPAKIEKKKISSISEILPKNNYPRGTINTITDKLEGYQKELSDHQARIEEQNEESKKHRNDIKEQQQKFTEQQDKLKDQQDRLEEQRRSLETIIRENNSSRTSTMVAVSTLVITAILTIFGTVIVPMMTAENIQKKVDEAVNLKSDKLKISDGGELQKRIVELEKKVSDFESAEAAKALLIKAGGQRSKP